MCADVPVAENPPVWPASNRPDQASDAVFPAVDSPAARRVEVLKNSGASRPRPAIC